MTISSPTAIAMTTVFGYVFDDDGSTPIENASVKFISKAFMIDDNLIKINETVLSDSAGLYQASLPQTSSIGEIVNIEISWTDSDGNVGSRKETIAVGTTSPVSVQESRVITVGSAVVGASGGDVVGPAAGATDNAIPRYDGTTGKLLQDSGVLIDDSNNMTGMGTVDGRDIAADGTATDLNTAKVTNATHTGDVTGATALSIDESAISGKTLQGSPAGTEEVLINEAGTLKKTTIQDIADLGGGGGGDVSAAANMTDNALVKGDGGAKGVQDSGILVDDSDNVSGIGNISLSGTVDGRDVAADGTTLDAIFIPITAYVKDVKSAASFGGTFTSGAWRTRDLNTLTGDTSFISLATNVITLDAGTYTVHSTAPAANVNGHLSRLQNTSDATTALLGSSEYINSASSSNSFSVMIGEFTIAAEKDFELQHRCQTSAASFGFGLSTNFSVDNTFSQIAITKIA